MLVSGLLTTIKRMPDVSASALSRVEPPEFISPVPHPCQWAPLSAAGCPSLGLLLTLNSHY
jgi:hypothetical protein